MRLDCTSTILAEGVVWACHPAVQAQGGTAANGRG